jgi:hypothetical protein
MRTIDVNAHAYAKAIVEMMRESLLVLDADWKSQR